MTEETNPTSALKFRHPWREYQARVLDASKLHLADKRLHIVAAPGSGKTTLGLEYFRRLGEPTLVLSPTRVIRDQWVDRLAEFTSDSDYTSWTSTNLDSPAFLTSITYQALHSKYRLEETLETDDPIAAEEESEIATEVINADETSALITTIQAAGFKTLILDEAHHLRAAWWKALATVVEAIPNMVVVSLTATPPYEANPAEWKRYEELCGPIDEEISVPELVKAGTLCPHQDYVWTVVPSVTEKKYLDEHLEKVDATLTELEQDETLRQAVMAHAWVQAEVEAEDALYSRVDDAIALLVYMKDQNIKLPKELVNVLALDEDDVPRMDEYWWQLLIGVYLYKPLGWPESETFDEHRKALSRRLRERHLLRQRELQLNNGRLMKRHMTQSSAKINACVEIYAQERRERGNELRQVVLTDYIRYTEDAVDGDLSLGAWPVFQALVESVPEAEMRCMALLTGRLVLLPRSIAENLDDELNIETEPFQHLEGFVRVASKGQHPVALVTSLLEAGRIQVLVGTRALLGEGWDAPCINSLILASSVGSYMLTNQMRGRAIRIDKRDPDKVSSIWHIVAIVLDQRLMNLLNASPIFWPGLADLHELDRRFDTFMGLSEGSAYIENSLLRVELPYLERIEDKVAGSDLVAFKHAHFVSAGRLEAANERMVERLRSRSELATRWQDAIGGSHTGQIAPSVSPQRPPTVRAFHLRRTLYYVIANATILLAIVTSFSYPNLQVLGFFIGAALLWSLPKLFVAGRLAL